MCTWPSTCHRSQIYCENGSTLVQSGRVFNATSHLATLCGYTINTSTRPWIKPGPAQKKTARRWAKTGPINVLAQAHGLHHLITFLKPGISWPSGMSKVGVCGVSCIAAYSVDMQA